LTTLEGVVATAELVRELVALMVVATIFEVRVCSALVVAGDLTEAVGAAKVLEGISLLVVLDVLGTTELMMLDAGTWSFPAPCPSGQKVINKLTSLALQLKRSWERLQKENGAYIPNLDEGIVGHKELMTTVSKYASQRVS
jgi:hypothetical protein